MKIRLLSLLTAIFLIISLSSCQWGVRFGNLDDNTGDNKISEDKSADKKSNDKKDDGNKSGKAAKDNSDDDFGSGSYGDVRAYDVDEMEFPEDVRLDLIPIMEGFKVIEIVDNSDLPGLYYCGVLCASKDAEYEDAVEFYSDMLSNFELTFDAIREGDSVLVANLDDETAIEVFIIDVGGEPSPHMPYNTNTYLELKFKQREFAPDNGYWAGGEDDEQDYGDTASYTSRKPADLYIEYSGAKNDLVSNIMDALGEYPEIGFEGLSLLGAVMVDVLAMPAAFMGLGEVAVSAGLAAAGATDVEYEEDGNSYKVTFSSVEGKKTEFLGEYDPAADALLVEVAMDDGSYMFYECRRSPYGFVGQVFTYSEDGTTEVLKVAVDTETKGGTIGISSDAGQPAPITGREPIDFPKDCQRWYSIVEDTFTCLTSTGNEYEFGFIPSTGGSDA